MAHASTGRLREDLDRVEEELGSARLQEHRTGVRHDREGSAETEAVLEAHRTRAERAGVSPSGRRYRETLRYLVEEGPWKRERASTEGTGIRPAATCSEGAPRG